MSTGFTDYENVRNRIISWLKANLTEERFIHTLGVEETASELAIRYGIDPKKASIAGLLHDNAKCFSNEELSEIIKTKLQNLPQSELLNYKTFHAPVGELFAREKFNIEDEEILCSIRVHTLGRVGMTTFDKIIFLSDKIEARTREKAYRERILGILDANKGEKGLNMALFECFKETIKSLAERELAICPATIEVYNWLLLEVKNSTK